MDGALLELVPGAEGLSYAVHALTTKDLEPNGTRLSLRVKGQVVGQGGCEVRLMFKTQDTWEVLSQAVPEGDELSLVQIQSAVPPRFSDEIRIQLAATHGRPNCRFDDVTLEAAQYERIAPVGLE